MSMVSLGQMVIEKPDIPGYITTEKCTLQTAQHGEKEKTQGYVYGVLAGAIGGLLIGYVWRAMK